MPGPFEVQSPLTPGVTRVTVDSAGNIYVGGALVLLGQSATPTVPAPGRALLFTDSTGTAMILDGSGNLTALLSNARSPHDNGFLGWTSDPSNAGGSTILPTSGTVQLTRVKLNNSCTVTNVHICITTAGATLTSAQNFLGLYDSFGTRLGVTADQTTAFATTGLITGVLTTPVKIPGGFYYIGILSNGTTLPTLLRSTTVTANSVNVVNLNLTAATARLLTGPAAQTTLPSSIALGSQSMNVVANWWGAVS